MARRGVPTARAGVFEDVEKATAFVDELGGRAVVKADGLAAGKGVTVATRPRDGGRGHRRDCLIGGAFGAAGSTVVVEELLEGPEVSVFVVADGTGSCVLLDACRTTSGSATATPGRTPVAWARTRRCRSLIGDLGDARSSTPCIAPVIDELAAVSRGAVRRPDADRRRSQGARVQLPVRRPRDRRCWCRACRISSVRLLHACATGTLAESRGARRLRRGRGGHRGARERGLPGRLPDRCADQRGRGGRGARGRHRVPRRDGPRRATGGW